MYDLIEQEKKRQWSGLELIASEVSRKKIDETYRLCTKGNIRFRNFRKCRKKKLRGRRETIIILRSDTVFLPISSIRRILVSDMNNVPVMIRWSRKPYLGKEIQRF